MNIPSVKDVRFTEGFWADYRRLAREVILPYQWEALNDRIPDAEPSHAIRNMRIAAGLDTGKFKGFVFQDSDLYKWIEAVGYSLARHPDPEMEANADSIIDLIENAQKPDGYLDTYYILGDYSQRFTNLLDCHELYCLGHMIEGAVAYYEGTGKRKLLDVACRFSDLIDRTFGPEEGKVKGYPGHEEIELALVRLAEATGEARYARLAEFFINERGAQPSFFLDEWEKRGRTRHWNPNDRSQPDTAYNQAHIPVREQTEAVGHSVRACYLYAGMADVARVTGDAPLKKACEALWNNIENKQMYVTGGIGQTNLGEAFTFDYDLPNETVYNETCASIALVFFARRMLALSPEGRYGDVMERALYNGIISGVQRDGKRFFYVNPMDVWPEASAKNPTRYHVKPVRQRWYGCACCPPNVARLLTSLGQYAYSAEKNTAFIHLYAASESKLTLDNGEIRLTQKTDYPWNENIDVAVSGQGSFTVALRIPGWSREAVIFVDNKPAVYELREGYAYITREWSENHIELKLPMPVEILRAHPNVRADAGKVAIQRGPTVYCLEEADNGANLSALRLTSNAFEEKYEPNFLEPGVGAVLLEADGERVVPNGHALYSTEEPRHEKTRLTFVPYSLWGNREEGEMAVWVRK